MDIVKTFVCDGKGYYERHLRIMNAMLPVMMTEKEVEFLGCWMYFGGGEMDERIKRLVKECMGLSASGFSNYMSGLRKKGFVRGDEIWKRLLIDSDEQRYGIRIIREEE